MVSKSRPRRGEANGVVGLARGGSHMPKNGLKGSNHVDNDEQNAVAGGECSGTGASGGSGSTASYVVVMVVPVR